MSNATVKIDFYHQHDFPEIVMRMAISRMTDLSNQRVFIDACVGQIAVEMGKRLASEMHDEFLEKLVTDIRAKIVERVATELFPEVIKKIDADVLAKMVAIGASREVRKDVI